MTAEVKKFKLPERKHTFYVQTLHAQGRKKDEIAKRVAERFPDLHENRTNREELVVATVGMMTHRFAEKIKPTSSEPELAAIKLELAATEPEAATIKPDAATIKPDAVTINPEAATFVPRPDLVRFQARHATPVYESRRPRHGRAGQEPASNMPARQQRSKLPAPPSRHEDSPRPVLPTGMQQSSPPPIKAYDYAPQDKHIIFIQTLHSQQFTRDEIIKRAAAQFPDLHQGHPKRMEMVESTVDMHTHRWAKKLI